MVGIVVVAHSRALARAAVALAKEMVHGKGVTIRVAAGLDERTLGTDAVQIMEAITSADDGDGVVVLMDLGSAVLSAELALDLLEDDARGRVVLCPAPLVEGLVVAAVAAASGAGRAEVNSEAAAALAGKQAHLVTLDEQRSPADPDDVGTAGPPAVQLVQTFTVSNPHGLHARPAALLVQAVRSYDARVELVNLTTGVGPVPASSLSKVATLGALRGHEVQVAASGAQAREALEQILALARRGFDELEPAGSEQQGPGVTRPVTAGASPPPAPGPGGSAVPTAPMPASPGIGIGPVMVLRRTKLTVPDAPTRDPRGEWRALREATASVRRAVQQVRARTARELGEADAAIFDAHLLLLDDPEMLEEVHAKVRSGQSAAAAWASTVDRVSGELAAVPDPYFQARAADIDGVGGQVLRALLGAPLSPVAARGVLVAPDLTPAEAAELDRDQVTAIVLAFGSPTAHSAILARSQGIPAVVGAGPGMLEVPEGTVVAVDGRTGEIVINPSDEALSAFRRTADDLVRRRAQALEQAAAPAFTRDGVPVLVAANIGSAADAQAAREYGADLAGLVRTEFLFLGRSDPPEIEEQEITYRRIADGLEGRRCTFRTLDVGGDKPLDYLPVPAEANPYLGLRGIRLSLARPSVLSDQLLAIVRVAHDHPVDLMFPMVSTLDELIVARRMVDDAIKVAGKGDPPDLRVGIMVEVPATALKVSTFAPHVDFLSIGTNDLTQYALAAERGNQAVAHLGDPLDPGVLRLIDMVCKGAGDRVPVAVCGELAADESAAAVLIGLGVRELSVSPPSVPSIKQAVRLLDSAQAGTVARAALEAGTADAVRGLLVTSPNRWVC